MFISKIELTGTISVDPSRDDDGLLSLAVGFDGKNNLRILARGPIADSLSTFRRGHSVVLQGELACGPKGVCVVARSVKAA